LQFFIKKRLKQFFSCIFFYNFWSSKPWIRIVPDPYLLEMLDPNPYPDSLNPDPQDYGFPNKTFSVCDVGILGWSYHCHLSEPTGLTEAKASSRPLFSDITSPPS
jgi:hypothetical protein